MTDDVLRTFLLAGPDDEAAVLTARELEVVRLLADGNGNQQIARALGMTPRTVSSHMERVKEKLGLHTRTSLLNWYLEECG